MLILSVLRPYTLGRSVARLISSSVPRTFNALSPAVTNNDAAFPKPEYVDGIGDGVKDYGFPARGSNRGPKWYEDNIQDVRFHYRGQPNPKVKLSHAFSAIFWFFIFWWSYTIPEHVLGDPEFYRPDGTQFSDEELGIPPDDVEETGYVGQHMLNKLNNQLFTQTKSFIIWDPYPNKYKREQKLYQPVRTDV